MEKINDEQLKREMAFDHYGRYAVMRDIISLNRKNGKRFNVLDVGGRGNIMKKFLPDDDVFYLDPLVETDDKNYIEGDGCAMPLKDESFDWVVSADVFEHIPDEKREEFLRENIRVARQGVILAAPFYSKEVVRAEINANENFKILSGGGDHIWLGEHIQNGLPNEKYFEKFLEGKKLAFQKLHNNRLFLWQMLIEIGFLTSENFHDGIENETQSFNYFYNSEVVSFDNQEPSYRKIYFIKKDESLNDMKVENKAIEDILFLKTISRALTIVDRLSSMNKKIIQQKDQVIQQKDQVIQQKDQVIQQKDQVIQQKDRVIQKKDQEINFMQSSKFWKLRDKFLKLKNYGK